jgi:tetratricopeptide (TPR) repeat protein
MAEQRPGDAFTLFALAKEYEKLGHLRESLETYLQLVASNPGYVGAYYHLGKLQEELEMQESALLTYDKGIIEAEKAGDHHALAELRNAAQNLRMEML